MIIEVNIEVLDVGYRLDVDDKLERIAELLVIGNKFAVKKELINVTVDVEDVVGAEDVDDVTSLMDDEEVMDVVLEVVEYKYKTDVDTILNVPAILLVAIVGIVELLEVVLILESGEVIIPDDVKVDVGVGLEVMDNVELLTVDERIEELVFEAVKTEDRTDVVAVLAVPA